MLSEVGILASRPEVVELIILLRYEVDLHSTKRIRSVSCLSIEIQCLASLCAVRVYEDLQQTKAVSQKIWCNHF